MGKHESLRWKIEQAPADLYYHRIQKSSTESIDLEHVNDDRIHELLLSEECV